MCSKSKKDMLIALLHAFYYNGVCHQYKNSDMTFEKTYQRFLDEDVNVREKTLYGIYYEKLSKEEDENEENTM